MSTASRIVTPFISKPSALSSQCLNPSLHFPSDLFSLPPDLWTKEDVQKWLLTCRAEWEVDIPRDKFTMNGRALCVLTKKDFLDRSPEAGDLLYNTLHSALASCRRFGSFSDIQTVPPYSLSLYNLSARAQSPRNYSYMPYCLGQRRSNEIEDLSVSSSQPDQALADAFHETESTGSPSSEVPHNKQKTVLQSLKSNVTDNQQHNIPTTVQKISNESKNQSSGKRNSDVEKRFDKPLSTAVVKLEILENGGENTSALQNQSVDQTTKECHPHTPPASAGDSPPTSPDEGTSDAVVNKTRNGHLSSTKPLCETKADGKLLWEFLNQLLDSGKYDSYIRWVNMDILSFKIMNPSGLAQLWGRQKNRENMTYEKLSRALRYYYKMNIITKVPGKRLTYKFLQNPFSIKRGQRGAKVGSRSVRRTTQMSASKLKSKTSIGETTSPPNTERKHSTPQLSDHETVDSYSVPLIQNMNGQSLKTETQDLPMDLSVLTNR